MRKIKFLLATIMMLVGATTTHAEDITSNLSINLDSYGYTSDDHTTVNYHTKSEYTVKEGVSVTFRGMGATITFYLNGTAVKTLSGYTTYTWTAKKDAKINFADYGQNKIYLTETATVAVTGVTLSPTSGELTAGGAALELTPTVAPEGATDKTVKWSVEQEGSIVALYTDEACTQAVGTAAIAAAKVYVKPLAAGQATITVTTNDGAKTATCAVTVAEPTYNVTFKEGTDDATSWQGKAGEGEYQSLPLTGLEAGTAVSVKYNGTKKVKSVKAKKKQ
jgi:uncharacterized protein YjdB